MCSPTHVVKFIPRKLILEPKTPGRRDFKNKLQEHPSSSGFMIMLGGNNFSFLNPHSAQAPAIPLHDFPVPVVQFGDEIEKGGATIKAQSEVGHHNIHVDLHVATWHAAKTVGERM